MAYIPTVQSRIQLATTSSTSANLGNTLFVTTNMYMTNRLTSFSTFTEVRESPYISTTSNAYAALRLAFSQPGANTPIYLGRRSADTLALTPTSVVDNATYSLTVSVTQDSTNTTTSTDISITSGATATAASIATALQVPLDAVDNITAVDDGGYVTVTEGAGYTLVISELVLLTDTYTTSESASTLLAAIMEEDNENWYYMTTEDQTEVFTKAMAIEIEATDSSDYPKIYQVSYADSDVLATVADPATDIMGELKTLGYARTAAEWHDQAATLFPEVARTAYNGQFDPGTTTWNLCPTFQVLQQPLTLLLESLYPQHNKVTLKIVTVTGMVTSAVLILPTAVRW